jgi:hypothetical protein
VKRLGAITEERIAEIMNDSTPDIDFIPNYNHSEEDEDILKP